MHAQAPHFLVLGAGVGGICSAIDLAEAGCAVTLVEKGPRTGGILPQLDHQFPDDHCGMCRMLPMIERDAGRQTCLKRGLFHEGIRVLTRTTLTGLTGDPGRFTATLATVGNGVDALRCNRCMACIECCPVMVPDAFNDRVGQRKAVFRPFFGNPEALPTIDWDHCTRCGACAAACPNAAIDLEPHETRQAIASVAGVIVAGGNALYDPAATDLYGYGVLPNVVTATAFERILSGSGPYDGLPVRPADGKPIRRVAWIQCVGSRNIMIGSGHCSTVCCMVAVKEALLAKHRLGDDVDTTIFYMDLRSFGRDDQRYRDRAEKEKGVRFVRCRIHSVEPAENPGDLKLTYLDDSGQPVEGVFDLVVLSTGAGRQPALPPFLAERVDQGAVVALGPEVGLLAIRETVRAAHGAASVLLHKAAADGRQPFIPASGRAGEAAAKRLRQQPVVQVLLLENALVKAPVVDWPAVETAIQGLPGCIHTARWTLGGPRQPDAIMAAIEKSTANRLLIVANHFGPFLRLLENRLAGAGFPPPLVAWVDLSRDDLGMGHAADSTDGVARSIRVAASRLIHQRHLRRVEQPVDQTALVIGAGPAGLSAAVSLADQGVAVHLVEQADALGGNGPRIQDESQRRTIEQLIDQASHHRRIALHTGAHLRAVSGSPGRFTGWIMTRDTQTPVAFGAAVIATGGREASSAAYGLGSHPRLVSHFDFEKTTLSPGFAEERISTVVMIQCAGSREEPRNYCSRTCCVKNLENAMRVRRRFPQARIVVFYRDIMTEGAWESVYAEARTQRIRFVPFTPSNPPVVRAEGDRVIVAGFDPILGEDLRLPADVVSLAVGLVPEPVHDLCRLFAVPTTVDGFVREADAKWRPVDTINPGVFVCGLARGPLRAAEAVAEGKAAALRALRLLAHDALPAQRQSARVRHAICSRCYLCVDACPYGARIVDGVLGQVMVDAAGCQGCGTCAAVCPNSATVMGEAEDQTLLGMIEAALT